MEYLAIPAAICSTSASLPQVFKTPQNVSDISMSLRGVGAVMWVIYALHLQEYALAVSSGIAACFECILFIKKHWVLPTLTDNETSPTVDLTDFSQP
jgi:uncharacterized protein with PQ loop repeat